MRGGGPGVGAARWRRALGGCGPRVAVGVGYDGSVVAACGHALRGFAADAGGDGTVGPPLIDRAGVTYATLGATVIAIDRAGVDSWRRGLDPDRALSALGVSASGALLVDTTVEPFAAGDVVFHPDPDPRLYALDRRDGAVRELDRSRGWPTTATTANGRVPWPIALPVQAPPTSAPYCGGSQKTKYCPSSGLQFWSMYCETSSRASSSVAP